MRTSARMRKRVRTFSLSRIRTDARERADDRYPRARVKRSALCRHTSAHLVRAPLVSPADAHLAPRGAGAKPGLEIWRIEKKVPVPVPEAQVAVSLLSCKNLTSLVLRPVAKHTY